MDNRHQFRADWHDYNDGVFFVTICCANKQHLFGHISNGQMNESPLGNIVNQCIRKISEVHKDTEIWNYVIMPNHIHMVIAVGTRYIASGETYEQGHQMTPQNIGCLKPPKHDDETRNYHHNARLSVIVGSFKAAVTRTARTRCIASLPCWQPRYHEHIIRNKHALDNIMAYIDSNIENWDKDCFYIS